MVPGGATGINVREEIRLIRLNGGRCSTRRDDTCPAGRGLRVFLEEAVPAGGGP